MSTVSVTPGQTFTITAKINPSPPSCGNGADIWIDAGSGPIALARGGIGGGLWGFSGGAGGSAADSLGDVTHSGGHGGAGMFVGPAEETSPSAGGGGGGMGQSSLTGYPANPQRFSIRSQAWPAMTTPAAAVGSGSIRCQAVARSLRIGGAPTYGYRGGGGGSGLNYLFCGGGNWGFGGPATYEVWLRGRAPRISTYCRKTVF